MSSASANINSKAYFLLHGNNEKLPEKNSTLSNYFYKKPFSDQQVCQFDHFKSNLSIRKI